MARLVAISLILTIILEVSSAEAATKIPVLYSTDLHHPHEDPDDHFDLATLFSLPELEVRGIVLDCGSHQLKAPGSIPVKQMLHLTSQQVPYAIGLGHALRSPDDDGCDQPDKFQRGVQLILNVLRNSPEPVTVFTTGSLRDVAAAFNRQPELLRRKVARLYINIGNPAAGADSRQWEYNVKLDRSAYCCIMRSGLPIYWCPCFDGGIWQRGRQGTYWKFVHARVLDTGSVGTDLVGGALGAGVDRLGVWYDDGSTQQWLKLKACRVLSEKRNQVLDVKDSLNVIEIFLEHGNA